MKKKAEFARGKQVEMPVPMGVAMQQLMLPLLLAGESLKRGLLAFVQQVGLLALQELLAAEAEMIAGPKGKHSPGRTHHHWGSTSTTLPFGGRHLAVERPRVRRKGKGEGETELPSISELRHADPMSKRVAEQIALGVSTRSYERSLDPVDVALETRGASKSNASRALIANTAGKPDAFLHRDLQALDLVGIFIVGIEVAGQSIVIALGITVEGEKEPLGIWGGSTENATVATALVQNLVDRGLRVEDSVLFVIDGGKAFEKRCGTSSGIEPLFSAARSTRRETSATTCPRNVAPTWPGKCGTPTRAPRRRRRRRACSSWRVGSRPTGTTAQLRASARASTRH